MIEQQLEKARIYAYWSYLGIVCPVVGIIATLISDSINDRLVVDTDDQVAEADVIHSLATTGRTISILIIIIELIVAFGFIITLTGSKS